VGDFRGFAVNRAAAEGFAQNAADYEKARPSYPPEAVACIVGHAALGPGKRVIDLAAGTGKLTRLLVPTGAEVLAVEPVDAMRAQLVAAIADVEAVSGTAEAIPVDDEWADAVTVAQAFHWFDPELALREIRRALKPGGCLVLTWNTRDRSYEWVRRFGELLVDGDLERPYDMYYDVDYAAVVADAGGYTPVAEFASQWLQPFDEELLVARAASVSVVGTLPADERAAVLERVRELARTHPDLAGRDQFGFPYTTSVFWCHRA
jgi:ubiquinone/menaquinone biosynthesis C-methylase UbiE